MNVQTYIYEKLKEYSAIPAWSGGEHLMLAHLKQDFMRGRWDRFYWYDVIRNDFPYYSLMLDRQKYRTNHYLFCVHTDRILLNGVAPQNTIWYENGVVHGQLDNILSIAVLRYMAEIGYPISIVFTTNEEEAKSGPQIWEALRITGDPHMFNSKLPCISLDLDPIFDEEEFSARGITIRGNVVWANERVRDLRKLAYKNGISYTTNTIKGYRADCDLLRKYSQDYGMHVGIPIANNHSLEEKVRWATILDVVKLLSLVLDKS